MDSKPRQSQIRAFAGFVELLKKGSKMNAFQCVTVDYFQNVPMEVDPEGNNSDVPGTC